MIRHLPATAGARAFAAGAGIACLPACDEGGDDGSGSRGDAGYTVAGESEGEGGFAEGEAESEGAEGEAESEAVLDDGCWRCAVLMTSMGEAQVCLPSEDAEPGCSGRGGRAGDVCRAGTCAAGAVCTPFGEADVGFCSPVCVATGSQCADPPGGQCWIDRDNNGRADHCLWTCADVADCPRG